jgi:hypothetical protein
MQDKLKYEYEGGGSKLINQFVQTHQHNIVSTQLVLLLDEVALVCKYNSCFLELNARLKAPANASAVYSPKLRPHVTSTESIICWPPSRARSTSTAARLVT